MAESRASPELRRALPRMAAAPARERRSMGAGEILLTIGLCLLAGHLSIFAYFPSLLINAGGLAVIVAILGRVLFVKRDTFAFVLVIFFCSAFQYANHQGGLFNLVAFLLGVLVLVFQSSLRETGARDPLVTTLVVILLVSDLLGLLIRNPMPHYVIGLEGVSFTAFMVMFVIASHLNMSEARLHKLLVVSAVFLAFNFLVSMNQHYAVLQVETPLLGITRDLFYATSNAYGVFGSASSNGQYAMMMLALLAPLVSATARKSLRVRPLIFVPALVACGLTMVLANMRAAVLEAIVIMVIYFMMFSAMYRRFFRNAKYMNVASIGAVTFLATAGVWFGLENLESDFKSVQIGSVSALESGEALNRRGPWQVGLRVLETGNWWIGYGQGNDKSNLIAWGGKWTGTGEMGPMLRPGEIIGGGHFHNLYLALPTLYGWVGAVAYVLLFLVVVFRLFAAVRRYSLSSLTVVACLGFLMSLAFFLLDEIKSGNAVQTINYAMIAWIWLGLGLAVWRTLKAEVAAARVRRPPPVEAARRGAAEDEPEPEEYLPLPDEEPGA